MEINLAKIQEILPHRYPFLFIDKVIEYEKNKKAVAIKNVTYNEWFFQGHFPEKPLMPGVLVLEAMAQTGGIIIMQMEENYNKLAVLVGVDKVRFRSQVFPSDTLIITAELLTCNSRMGKIKAFTKINEKIVAEAEILFSLINKNES